MFKSKCYFCIGNDILSFFQKKMDMEISEIKERLTMANVLHYYGLKTELQLREKIHNHPNWRDVGPSGFKTAERSLKNSDRSIAEFPLIEKFNDYLLWFWNHVQKNRVY